MTNRDYCISSAGKPSIFHGWMIPNHVLPRLTSSAWCIANLASYWRLRPRVAGCDTPKWQIGIIVYRRQGDPLSISHGWIIPNHVLPRLTSSAWCIANLASYWRLQPRVAGCDTPKWQIRIIVYRSSGRPSIYFPRLNNTKSCVATFDVISVMYRKFGIILALATACRWLWHS